MAILKSCCCWDSVRRGSFASGVFTMVCYTLILTCGAFHISTVVSSIVLFILTLSVLIMSAICVISSVLLIVGLIVENPHMLLPWIVSISSTTTLDLGMSIYLLTESLDTSADIATFILFGVDFLLCALNVYCVLCVISQYQEYKAGRGRAGHNANRVVPDVKFQRGHGQALARPVPNISIKIPAENQTQSSSGYLLVPSPSTTSTSPFKSPLSTDLSSISEEQNSMIGIRRISADDSSADDVTLRSTISSQSYCKRNDILRKNSIAEETNREEIEAKTFMTPLSHTATSLQTNQVTDGHFRQTAHDSVDSKEPLIK